MNTLTELASIYEEYKNDKTASSFYNHLTNLGYDVDVCNGIEDAEVYVAFATKIFYKTTE